MSLYSPMAVLLHSVQYMHGPASSVIEEQGGRHVMQCWIKFLFYSSIVMFSFCIGLSHCFVRSFSFLLCTISVSPRSLFSITHFAIVLARYGSFTSCVILSLRTWGEGVLADRFTENKLVKDERLFVVVTLLWPPTWARVCKGGWVFEDFPLLRPPPPPHWCHVGRKVNFKMLTNIQGQQGGFDFDLNRKEKYTLFNVILYVFLTLHENMYF